MMPITFEIVPGKNYFISLWSGNISDSELMKFYKNFLEGPDCKLNLNEFADLSALKFTSITSSGIMQFSSFTKEFLISHDVEIMRSAVYCTDALTNDMAKIYSYWIDDSPEKVRIFNDYNDAESWLNTDA